MGGNIVVSEFSNVYWAITPSVSETVSVTEQSAVSGLGSPSALAPNQNDAISVTESVAGSLLANSPFRQGKLANASQVTLDMPVLGRNTLAMFIRWQSATINLVSVTDNLGNTYTLVENPVTVGSGARAAAAVAADVAAGATTIFATFDSTPTQVWMAAHEVTQRDLLAPIDGHSGLAQTSAGATDGISSGQFTTTRDGAYLFGGTSDSGHGSLVEVGTNFFERTADIPSQVGFVTEDRVQTTAAAGTQVTFTGSAPAFMTIGIALQYAHMWLPSLTDAVSVVEATTVNIANMPVLAETITVDDSTVQLLLLPGRYDVFDAVTVTEFAGVNVASFPGLLISVFDTVLLEAQPAPTPNIAEAITVTDLVLLRLTGIQVADTITVSDFAVVARMTLRINVFDDVFLVIMAESWDTVTITENIAFSFVTFGSKAMNMVENVFLTESVTVAFSRLPATAFEAVAVTDASVTLLPRLPITLSDSVTLTESASASLRSDLNLSVFDAVTLTENVQLTLATSGGALVIATNDSITVSEFVMLALNIAGVFDAVTLTESVTVVLKAATQVAVATSDAITVTESTALTFQSNPLISVFDAVTLTESVSAAVVQLKLSVDDSVTVTESSSLEIPAGAAISVFDTVTVTESVAGKLSLLRLEVFEAVNVGEGRDAQANPLLFTVFDHVGVLEDATTGALDVGPRLPEARIRGTYPWEQWIRRG